MMAQSKKNNNDNSGQHPLPRAFVTLWLAALVVIFVSLSVRGSGYFYSPDDLMNIDIAKGTTLSQVWQFSLHEIHPPLGYVLRHFWLMVSDNASFVRSESLLFGVMLVLLYYRIGSLLAGEFAGLCTAALTAFSHAVIIQSYVVRHYTFFLFFLSLAFYYYLLWRKKTGNATLACYGSFAILACLTHFSGVFAIFCIAAYEVLRLRGKKAAGSEQACWIFANGCVAGIAGLGYYLWYAWQSVLVAAHTYFNHEAPPKVTLILLHPLMALGYLLPHADINAYVVGAAIQIPLLLLAGAWFSKPVRVPLILTILSLALGMLLFAKGLYPFLGDRHVLWIAPFVTPAMGLTLAAFGVWVTGGEMRKLCVVAVIVLAGGCAADMGLNRFAEPGEYSMPEKDWKEWSAALAKYDGTSVIISGRTDVFLIDPPGYNPYLVMHQNMHKNASVSPLVPYHHAHILFDPRDLRIYNTDVLLRMMQEAREQKLLEGKDTLIFVNTSWNSEPIVNLMLCATLAKKVITFPAHAGRSAPDRDGIMHSAASLLIVSKKTFFEDVVAAKGRAHSCLMKESKE